MKKYYILKPGKGDKGKGGKPLTVDDFLVLAIPETTLEISNKGDISHRGTNPYIGLGDLIPTGSKGLISQNGIQLLQDYDFKASVFTWALADGRVYFNPITEFTLDPSDGSQNRVDLVIGAIDPVTNEGYIKIKPGDLGLPAPKPSLDDEANEIELTFINVNAGTTTPDDIAITVIYDENTESTTSGDGNFDSAVGPKSGVKCIQTTNFVTDNELKFVMPAPFNPQAQDLYQFWIESTSGKWDNWGAIDLAIFNGTTQVSDWIRIHSRLGDGPYSFQSNDSGYTAVGIPTFAFFLTSAVADTFIFRKLDNAETGGGNPGDSFKIDLFRMQSGLTATTLMKTKLSEFINDGNGDINFPFITSANVSGLEAIDEGNGVGWRLIGRDETLYGPIGEEAVDFSWSETVSSVIGATGENSFSAGYENQIGGYASVGFGYYNIITSDNGFAQGESNTVSGHGGFVIGYSNNSTGALECMVMGTNNDSSSGASLTAGLSLNNDANWGSAMFGASNELYTGGGQTRLATDRIFVIGNGTFSSTNPWEAIVRSNALSVTRDGKFKMDSYGGGTITGTATKIAAWDADGNLIEEDLPAGGFVPYSGATGDVDLNAKNLSNVLTYNGTALGKAGGINNFFFGNEAFDSATGDYNTAIGFKALKSNTENNNVAVGYQALENNTGEHSVGIGVSALKGNTGYYCTAVGHQAGMSNTATECTFIGWGTGSDNSGTESTACGYNSLIYNTGGGAVALGVGVGYRNVGGSAILIGQAAGENNTGDLVNFMGYHVAYYNNGDDSIGIGEDSCYYNDGNDVVAIGSKSNATFKSNTAGNKTFAFGDVDVGLNRITVTGHSFGSTDDYVNVYYTEGTDPVGGIYGTVIYNVKIIDANTLEFRTGNRGVFLTSTGSGTGHILTPQYKYNNIIVLGANAEPTKSNQVTLGDSNVDEVVMGNGDIIYPALRQKEVTDATYTILDSDHGLTIWFNRGTTITVTLDLLTRPNFSCNFYNEGAGDVDFVNGTATAGYPDGTKLVTDAVGALIRKMATTTYKYKGEFTT